MADESKKPTAREHFGKPVIKVSGHELVCDIDDELVIDDVNEGMNRVAAVMGFWASVWSAAAEQQIEVDGHYRAWRANRLKEALADDPKMAEWKAKAEVESDPKFIAFKHAIAHAERAVILARGMFDSAEGKSRGLQSRGAMIRDEFSAIGMSTPSTPRPRRASVVEEGADDAADVDSDPEPETRRRPLPKGADGRVSAMKNVFRNKGND